MMVKAVRIHRVGGPEVLTYEDITRWRSRTRRSAHTQ